MQVVGVGNCNRRWGLHGCEQLQSVLLHVIAQECQRIIGVKGPVEADSNRTYGLHTRGGRGGLQRPKAPVRALCMLFVQQPQHNGCRLGKCPAWRLAVPRQRGPKKHLSLRVP